MHKPHLQQKLDENDKQLSALEEKAGIGEAMKRAHEGRFIPLGAFGERVTPGEYFADEYDYLRKKTRDAYFSVEDLETRRQLIELSREEQAIRVELFEADVFTAQQALRAEKAKSDVVPWAQPTAIAAGAVALGYWWFQLPGAIGGAVCGFFLGQSMVAEARATAKRAAESTADDLKMAQDSLADIRARPEMFSMSEELSGERDGDLDRESARGNLLRAKAKAAQQPIT